ncbi:helix-turn-helix transcriptional regulator [Streptomyces sp. F63]|uniref:helix-turn-helix transcriptional regulator n=1 Tax=Streptomyces sp. F63 TaxID=2824887 RepID=UPI001B38AF11|nr:helix-turn-helix transcriptional regulator [Streptomyces sp. F63]MBQ0984807.1 helix-turn-helix transcriptional regulator [Streptomyces sp. F63]
MSAGDDNRPPGRPDTPRTGRRQPPPGAAAAAPADGGTEARARAAYAALLRQLTLHQADTGPDTAPGAGHVGGPGGTGPDGMDPDTGTGPDGTAAGPDIRPTRPDSAGPDSADPDETEPGRSRSEPDGTGPDGTGPGVTEPGGTGPGVTEPGVTEPGGTGPGSHSGGLPDTSPGDATADTLPEDVARWLTERRLLNPSRTDVSSPERAIAELLTGHRERLLSACTTLQRDLRAVEDVARLLPPPRLHGHDTVPVEFFTDRTQLRKRIDAFHPLTRHELLSMRTTFPEPEVLEESLVTDLEVLARGAACRLLVSASALRKPGAARYVESVAEAGAEVRVATSVPLYLLIVDRELTVMWAGLGSDHDCGDVALHGSLIASCFVQVFEHSWAAASPHTPGPPAGRAQSPQDYTPREREVLALLATGAKDESIARRLGISERTLRRLMNQLIDKLGVESRFAAGVRAARLGLVD